MLTLPTLRQRLLKHLAVAALLTSSIGSAAAVSLETGWGQADLGAPPASRAVTADTARKQYAVLCAGCHGWTGKGDGSEAPYLATTVPDLTTAGAWGGPVDRVAIVRAGRGAMPAYGYALDNDAAEALLGYMRAELGPDASHVTAAAVPGEPSAR